MSIIYQKSCKKSRDTFCLRSFWVPLAWLLFSNGMPTISVEHVDIHVKVELTVSADSTEKLIIN